LAHQQASGISTLMIKRAWHDLNYSKKFEPQVANKAMLSNPLYEGRAEGESEVFLASPDFNRLWSFAKQPRDVK